MEKLLTIDEVSKIIGYKTGTIYNQINQGKLKIPYIKLPGGDVRFKPSEVEKFIDRRTVKPKAA